MSKCRARRASSGEREQASPALAEHVGALPLCSPGDLVSLWEKEGCASVRPQHGVEMGGGPCRGHSLAACSSRPRLQGPVGRTHSSQSGWEKH